jgi:hypothetical protein
MKFQEGDEIPNEAKFIIHKESVTEKFEDNCLSITTQSFFYYEIELREPAAEKLDMVINLEDR